MRDVERLFGNYQYGEAGRQIYDFFWSEFADWYLEIAKLQLNAGGDRAFYTARTLVWILDICLRMLHPFTPFVTEELWGHQTGGCRPFRRAGANGWLARGADDLCLARAAASRSLGTREGRPVQHDSGSHPGRQEHPG